jgi:small-conductance mechanosensitive channel
MDSGLQNSIATIIGYAGIILAVVIGLSEVGLDLQNVALVAGALSVGIGLGLQAIVSNFVSGLILLAERPVRVGDIISVKSGEEGYVRRISVRATEIETYDRATLIVPNSELITGVVKNRVYANTWARIHVAVKVGLESDAAAVEAAMLAAVADDPRILPTPRPRVLLSTIGDTALDFELVAVLASVETSPTVRSDLNKRVIAAFREAGIRLAGQAVPAAPATVVVTLEETLRALDSARSAAGVPQS